MKRRKLLRLAVLKRLSEDCARGVPLARAMRYAGLEGEITRPVVFKLLKVYDLAPDNVPLGSLAPDWVDQYGEDVQTQPAEWDYVGYFPEGNWVCKI